jgi:5-methylcytosine-specific restriction endonuclease McrA
MANGTTAKAWNGRKWIRDEKRAAIYHRDGWACVYCGRGLVGPHRVTGSGLTLDHLTPRSQGGSNHETNLVTACGACNYSRQDKPWREYATGGAQERIESLIDQPLDLQYGKALMASLVGSPVEEAR